MTSLPAMHPVALASAFVESNWSPARALAVALALTSAAAALGFSVSWMSEGDRVAPESDAPTLLAYSRSSARVSADLGGP